MCDHLIFLFSLSVANEHVRRDYLRLVSCESTCLLQLCTLSLSYATISIKQYLYV